MNSHTKTSKERLGNMAARRLCALFVMLCCAVGAALSASAVGLLDGSTSADFDGVSRSLIGESCIPANNAVDPGETETISVVIKRKDNRDATFNNVKVYLLPNDADGVKFVSGPQTVGTLSRNQSSSPLTFSFKNTNPRGAVVRLTLKVTDHPSDLASDQPDREQGTIVFNVETNADGTFKNVGDPFIVGAIFSTPYNFSNSASVTIRDQSDASDLPLPTPAGTYPTTINVAGVPTPDLSSNDRHILLYKAVVTLNNLSHDFSPDIDALLVGPNGKAVKLVSDSGFSPVSSATLKIDDDAAGFLPIEASSDAIISGTYKPSDFGTDADAFGVAATIAPPGQNALTFITGGLPVADLPATFNPNGDWKLYIIDDNRGGHGVLAGGWSLTVSAIQRIACYEGVPLVAGNSIGEGVPNLTGSDPRTSIDEDTLNKTVDFFIQSVVPGVGLGDLTVTPISSNTSIIPNRITDNNVDHLNDGGGFFVESATGAVGAGTTNRRLHFSPVKNASGTVTITLSVTGPNGLAGTTQFQVKYDAINDAPTVTPPGSQAQNVGVQTAPLPFTISDPETDASLLVVTARAQTDPSGLAPNSNIFLGGSGANRTIQVIPANTSRNSVTIEIVAIDPQGTSGTNTFIISFETLAGFPTINPIAPIVTKEDESKAVSVIVADPETPAESIGVSASVNPASDLITVSLTGTGTTRTLTVTPKPDASGGATVRITATDSSGNASTFDVPVTVTPVNDAPTISTIATTTILEDSDSGELGFTINDKESALGTLTVTATSSDQVLIPNLNVVVGGTLGARTVKITPAPNRFGRAIITVTVNDNQAGDPKTTSTTFTVEVTPVNDIPGATGVFTAQSLGTQVTEAIPLVLAEDAAETSVFVQGITPGALETGQTLTVTATSDNPAVFSNPVPVEYSSPAATARIKLNSNDNATGTATITVTVTDNGGTANGGSATFTTKFKVNVQQVNDAPTLSDTPTVFAGLGETIVVPLTVGDVDNAVSSLTYIATSSDQTVIKDGPPPTGGIVTAGAGPSRIVSLTVTSVAAPAPALFRDVIITNSVTDGGQTENVFPGSGGTLTVKKIFTVRVSNTKPNHRPHIAIPIEANRTSTTEEDAPIVLTGITVDDSADPAPPPGPNAGDLFKLVVSGFSDNQALISDVNIVPSVDPATGSPDRGLIIIPNKDANGTATITVRVTDAGDADGQNKLSADTTIKVTVTPVPDSPISLLTGSPTIVVNEDTDTSEGSNGSNTESDKIEFTTGDAETVPANLKFEITSSNTDLIPVANVVVGPPLGNDGRRRTLTIRGATNRNSGVPPAPITPVNVTVRTVDEAGQSAAFTVSVTIRDVNDQPTIDKPANVTYPQVTGPTTRTIQLTNVGPGGGDDEAGQTFLVKRATVIEGAAFVTIANPDTAIALGTEKRATLTITQNAAFGTSKIRIKLQDSGGTLNGGKDTTDEVDFTVTIGQVNQAPTISPIPNQVINQGDTAPPIAFSVSDGPGETPAANLIVTATADNPGLIPASGIVTGGSGTDRSLRITPAANQFGTANITVTVTDTGNSSGADVKSSSRTFLITVNQVQQRPQVSAIADVNTLVNTESDLISFTVSDQESAAGNLTVAAINSTVPLLIPLQNVQFGGSGGNRLMIIVPTTDLAGTSEVTIRVTDTDLPTAHFTDVKFKVNVARINTPPTVESLASQTINQGSTAGPLGFRVTDAETASGLLAVTAASSNQALVPNANILLGGTKNDRTITITPLPDQSGVTTISITVTDSGSPPGTTSNIKTATTSFTLTVLSTLNTPPTISDIAGVITEKNKPTPVIPFTVDDAETAKGFLVVTAQSSNAALIPPGNIFFGGSAGNRTVFITPGLDQTGTATVTLKVTDGGNLTDTTSFLVTVTDKVIPPPTSKAVDFNGDGKPDILFQDANAFIAFWSMDKENLVTAGLFNPNNSGNPDWRIVASGNFNPDTKSDLLFQHTNGDLAVWYMSGVNLTSSTLLNPANPGAGWKAIGTGDFNGDGKSDILLQHTDRTLAVWYMSGTDLTTSTLVSPANPGVEWAAVAVGDFNSDGNPDIVLEDNAGTLGVWFMNGVDLNSGSLLNPPGGDPNWRVTATTDLDGDGNADLIFQNTADGRLAAWFMNDVDLIRATYLNPASPGGTWQVVGP